MKTANHKSIIASIARAIAVMAMLVVLGATALAQSEENAARPDRGTRPNGSYAVSDIENISLNNGNLNLSIPLAGLPPIAGGNLSWAVRANYNSKAWDVVRQEIETGVGVPTLRYVKSQLQASDKGGWRIGGHYRIDIEPSTLDYDWLIPPPSDPEHNFFSLNPPHTWVKVILTTPDGATHELRPMDFTPYNGGRNSLWDYYNKKPDTNGTMRYYSFDGSFIWAKINPTSSNTKWEIYMPDGTRVSQTNSFQGIQDPNGNSIKVFSEVDPVTGLITTRYQDEETTGGVREVKHFFDASTNTEFVQYQTVGGQWITIDVKWGTTLVSGQTYLAQDHNPSTEQICTRRDQFSANLDVVREIILPQTEAGLGRKKFIFNYNSDTTESVSGLTWQGACGGPFIPITTASRGWGSLSGMTTPSGAQVNYSYQNDSSQQLPSITDIPAETLTQKSVTHDQTVDTWIYSIGPSAGSVTGPDGSVVQESFYQQTPGFSAIFGGQAGLGGLTYKTNNSGLEIIERRWSLKIFAQGSGITPGGANSNAPFNPVVTEEYRTIVGTPSKMSAKTFQYDFNGNLTKETHYDWFDPGSVTREGGIQNLPTVVPAGAVKLREINYSCHSPADASTSTNVYAKRVIAATPTPLILNAMKETSVGIGSTILSRTRMHYDGQAFDTLPVRGNVTLVRRDLDGAWLDTTYTYDPVHFNKASVRDPRNNVTQYFYEDSTHAAPTRIVVDPDATISGNELTTRIEYDYSTGVVKSQTDPNDKVTTTDYTNQLLGTIDPFSRPGKMTGPAVTSFVDGSTFTNEQRTAVTKYFDDARIVETVSDLNREDDGKLRSRVSADQLGRTVKTETSEDGGISYGVSSESKYKHKPGGANGSVIKSRNAHRAVTDSTDGWTRTRQDVLGRVIEVATFSGSGEPPDTGTNANWTGSVTTDYNGIYTRVTDQAGKQRRSVVDGAGRLVRVDEPNSTGSLGSETSPAQPTFYSYDRLGNLLTVTQGVQTRTFIYDSLSRLKETRNPEQVDNFGVQKETKYEYDAASNLISRTNPDLTSVTFTYDGLNRVKTKTLSSGGVWIYSYDIGVNSKGRLISVVRQGSSDGTYYDGYDAAGRLTASRQITDNQSYTMSYGYDLAGNMTKQVYPSGKELRTVYDSAGRLSSVSRFISGVFDKTYASGLLYTPAGATSQVNLGNGLRETTGYNSRLQPLIVELKRLTNTELVMGLDYGYGTTSNNGNVLSQTIKIGHGGTTTTISQSYIYDELNRLKTASEGSNWTQTYDYDRYGNRAVRISSFIPNQALTPTSNSATDLSAFNASTNRIALSGYDYDVSGNLEGDPTTGSNAMSYDSDNRMVSYTKLGVTTSYVYDGDGRRVKKVVGTAVTLYVYNGGGQLVAEYTNPDAVIEGGGGTSYLTSDHLGSTRVVTNATGGVKARHDYLPFGEELGSGIGLRTLPMGYSQADGLKQKFTGKERDGESGLDYFLARYYSASQGRFTSPDEFTGGPDELFDFVDTASNNPTFYADLTDPQSLNKYQYCYNNPLLYIDPNGHQGVREWFRSAPTSAGEFAGGVVRGVAASISMGYAPGSAPRSDDSIASRLGQATGTAIAIVAGTGAAGGGGTAAVATGPTVVGPIVGGAVAVGGVITVAGALTNAQRIVTTPIHYKSGDSNPYAKQDDSQLLKSRESYKDVLREHKQKLREYRTDPDKADHKGKLQGVSPEIRQKRIEGRIEQLKKQIRKHVGELRKIKEEIQRRGL